MGFLVGCCGFVWGGGVVGGGWKKTYEGYSMVSNPHQQPIAPPVGKNRSWRRVSSWRGHEYGRKGNSPFGPKKKLPNRQQRAVRTESRAIR